jgi:hypothetical protein
MTNNPNQSEQQIDEIRQLLSDLEQCRRAGSVLFQRIDHCLRSILEPGSPSIRTTRESIPIYVANGRKLNDTDIRTLNTDDYDIALNLIDRKLKVRKDPENHSDPIPIDLPGLGAIRLAILTYLLEHPQRGVCLGRLGHFYSFDDSLPTSDMLRQTIRKFRLLLGQKDSKGPYIVTQPVFGADGALYVMDSRWKYLVIKEEKF